MSQNIQDQNSLELPRESCCRSPREFWIGLILTFVFGFGGLQIYQRNECYYPDEPDIVNFDTWMKVWAAGSIIFPMIVSIAWINPESRWVIHRVKFMMYFDAVFFCFQMTCFITMCLLITAYLGNICNGRHPVTELSIVVVSLQPILMKFSMVRIINFSDILVTIQEVRRVGISIFV